MAVATAAATTAAPSTSSSRTAPGRRGRAGLASSAGYRPLGQVIDSGATRGVPTWSSIWACSVSGMSRGLPW